MWIFLYVFWKSQGMGTLKPILHRAIQSVIELEGIAIQLILYLQEKNNVI